MAVEQAVANQFSNLKPWKPGQSGNPSGRAKGIEALARIHTPAAIAALVEALDNPRERVPAAIALLDRAWGRPTQTIANEDGSSPLHLHLIAAQAVSREMIAERAAQLPPTIDSEPITNGTAHSLLDAPPPLE